MLDYQTLRFISNSGIDVTASFFSTSESGGHRLGEFSFIGVDGSYYQDISLVGRKFPIKAVVHGVDAKANLIQWRKALEDRGVGVLYHPDTTVGIVNVVVQSFSFSQNTVVKGKVEIEIEFLENILNLTTQETPVVIEQQLNNSIISQSENIIKPLSNFFTTLEPVQNLITSYIDSYEEIFSNFTRKVDSVNTFLLTTLAEIRGSINTLVTAPVTLLNAIASVLRTGSLVANQFPEVLNSYTEFTQTLFSDLDNTSNYRTGKQKEQFTILTIYFTVLAIYYYNLSSSNLNFQTREEGIQVFNTTKQWTIDQLEKIASYHTEFTTNYFNTYIHQNAGIVPVLVASLNSIFQKVIKISVTERVT